MNNQQIHLCPNCKSAHVHWWTTDQVVVRGGGLALAFRCHECFQTGVIPLPAPVVPIFQFTLAPEDPLRLERDYLERCYALELSR